MGLFPTAEPTYEPEPAAGARPRTPFPRSWRFDFDAGDFMLTPTGTVALADELHAYLEWCNKALLTPRHRHLIYGRNYGQEFEDLIRRNLTRAGNESEIKRMVTEALKVNPRTASVENFRFAWDGDAVYFTFDVTTARGETITLGSRAVTG
ncbi:MAG: DUF2634 domain-containing protein [Bacillota bacterium]